MTIHSVDSANHDNGALNPSDARRAIVIGGSMAGLLAARVLADRFDEVVLLERDALPDGAEHRKGVPQARHLHGLLARGRQLLDELFPGISAELMRGGAVQMDWGRDFHWHHFGGWKVLFDSGVDVLWLSRPFLEAEVRRRVFALPRVRRRDAHEVTGLLASADRSGVDGVRLRARAGDAGEHTLRAGLVVDATGRGSVAPKWLEALGYERPAESKVTVHVGYATRLYRRVSPSPFPWKAVFVYGTYPGSTRLGALVPIEGDRFIALVAGVLGDYPPDDNDGWLAFARSLPDDAVYRAAAASEPLGEIATYRFPHHLRRHYERVRRLPERFVVVGDALCSFNPIYGQGMTIAAKEAIALGACVDEQRRRSGDLGGLARRFHQRAARLVDIPWFMATAEDFRHPGVEGRRPPGFALLSWYLGRVHKATQRDPEVMRHFLRAMHMLGSPLHLFRPDNALRILRP